MCEECGLCKAGHKQFEKYKENEDITEPYFVNVILNKVETDKWCNKYINGQDIDIDLFSVATKKYGAELNLGIRSWMS